MKAIIIGATGATGKYLVEQLLENGKYSNITVLVRRKYFSPHPRLKEVVVNFDELEKYTKEITGDIAISCLGTTLKAAGGKDKQWKIDFEYQYQFAKLASENKVPTFILLSSMGANPNSKIFYSRMKGALEKKIETLDFPNLVIFRPGPLIRPGTDRMGEKLSLPVIQFLNSMGILRIYKPMHVQELAKAMITKSGINFLKRTEIVESKDIFHLLTAGDNN